MLRTRLCAVVGVALLPGLAAVGLMPTSSLAQGSGPPGFELRPGVIVDAERRFAYLMNPKGGIDAIALSRGEPLWTTREAAKPLAISGDLLVAQTEKSAAEELAVVILDTRKSGARVATSSVRLPAGTRASVDDTLTSAFVARGMSEPGAVLLLWDYSEFPQQGLVPGLDDGEAGGAARGATASRGAARVTSGAVRLDVSTRAISPLGAAEVSDLRQRRTTEAQSAERRLAVAGNQFVSADGRHVMVSERVADDRVWDKYVWTIYESGGTRLGQIRNHQSQAPFFVVDSQLVFETGPFVRQTEKGRLEEPLKIHATDLHSGKELWNRPVRDTVYRGPFPP